MMLEFLVSLLALLGAALVLSVAVAQFRRATLSRASTPLDLRLPSDCHLFWLLRP